MKSIDFQWNLYWNLDFYISVIQISIWFWSSRTVPRTRQGKIVLISGWLHFTYQDINTILHLQHRATHSASKIVLKSWWLHFTYQDIKTIFDRQKACGKLAGACGKPAGSLHKTTLVLNSVVIKFCSFGGTPSEKIPFIKIFMKGIFSEGVPKSRNFSDPVVLWIFAQKHNKWPPCLCKKISQKTRDTVEICKINFFRKMPRGWDKENNI